MASGRTSLDLLRRDLGIGIGHGEDQRLWRHLHHHVLGDRALDRKADEDIRAVQRLFEAARFGLRRIGRLPLVHARGTAAIDDAFGIAEDDIAARQAHRQHQVETGDARRARAVDHDFGVLNFTTRQVQRVDQPGRGDDRRAVLIVMENRNVHQLAQALFDDEAIGRLDVFEIDAAAGGAEIAHGADEGVDIFGVDLQIDGVDVGKTLEEDGFALHHRLGRQCAEIAQAQDRRAVGDHRHAIAPRGVVIGAIGIGGDGAHGNRDPGGIGKGKVALCRHRLGGADFELAGLVPGVKRQGFFVSERRTVGRGDGMSGRFSNDFL